MAIKVVDLVDGIMIEVVDVKSDLDESGGAQPESLQDQLDKVVDGIRLAFERVPNSIRGLATDNAPDEFEVEFGVSVTGKANAVFLGAKGSSTFKVKATWKKHPTDE